MISGLFIVLMIAAFAGLTSWAWSERRREDFDRAARQALVDEAPACCAERGTSGEPQS